MAECGQSVEELWDREGAVAVGAAAVPGAGPWGTWGLLGVHAD